LICAARLRVTPERQRFKAKSGDRPRLPVRETRIQPWFGQA
jgi:hypothetical protein